MATPRFIAGTFLAATVAFTAAHASATVIEDFESYTVDTFPSPDWASAAADVASLTDIAGQTILVRDNANNISGQHLEFATTYNADSINFALPFSLSLDGQYVQVAVNVVSGRTLASMFLTGSPYAGGSANPPAAVSISTEPGQVLFSTRATSAFQATSDSIVIVPDATPAFGTWYYLRATLRDNDPLSPGVLDSFDFHVFDDEMNLLGSVLGVEFVGGAGGIAWMTLRSLEQTGTQNAIVLFDQVTYGIPEPASAALLLAGSVALFGRRRRALA